MKRQTFPSKNGVTTLLATVLLAFAFDVQLASVPAQEKPAAAPTDRAARPLIRVPTALPLDEARVIVEAAKAIVKADNGRAAIAVVDFNGNLVSLDSMDGTSGFWCASPSVKRWAPCRFSKAPLSQPNNCKPIRNVFTARSACSAAR